MKLDYIGDALDHWKGSILEDLQKANLLRYLTVDAMASDAESWVDDDWVLYARMLRICKQQIMSHQNHLSNEHSVYIEEIIHKGDLFLDPNTGIATCPVKKTSRPDYLLMSDLRKLLRHDDSRVIAVYQHVRGQQTRCRLNRIVSDLQELDGSFVCGSYESSVVAMMFLSRNVQRVEFITNHFRALLGRHADNRVHLWGPLPQGV